MKKVHIRCLNKLIEFKDNIYSIVIEDPLIYRDLSLNLMNNLTYSINDKVCDFEKNSLIIYNPFELRLNDSKFVKGLHKLIEKRIKSSMQEKMQKIEVLAIELLEDISINLDSAIDYDINIDIIKFLSSMSVVYKEHENNEYIELLLTYIKLYRELYQCDVIVSFSMLNLLTSEEIQCLHKELELLDLYLLDIKCNTKNIESSLIVDEDWCII